MSTAEDVFYLYERNSRCYHDCSKIEECTDSYNDECYCHLKQDVIPFTIGDQYVPCDFKIKCYTMYTI